MEYYTKEKGEKQKLSLKSKINVNIRKDYKRY